jgi:peptidoglycan/LPS O-acetylase OafA/YrhL
MENYLMGAFRLFLALLVATAHLNAAVEHIPDILGSHAVAAVRVFFVLSGFYMAMVLQQGRYKRPQDFYASRLMKLLPIYWIVGAITLIAAAFGGSLPGNDPIRSWHQIDIPAMPASVVAYTATSLVTLIGSDTWTWIGFSSVNGAWSLAPRYADYATSPLVLSGVPQAWTIGLELCFYALAPFLARMRTTWLISMIVASILLRFWFNPQTPFDRSLFAFELPFFLSGMVAFRLIPTLTTIATRAGPIDAALGALSYPAYISHFLVFGLLYQMRVLALPWPIAVPLALVGVIGFSALLDRWVAQPIDILRTALGARSRAREYQLQRAVT